MYQWPAGFDRIPPEDWVQSQVGELALKYDSVEDHGWYRNLDRTVQDIAAFMKPGSILLDYSGGTGILAGRLLEEAGQRDFGILIVDSSPKFLRLALEKLGRQPRMAFRLIRYLKAEKRLQLLEEVLDSPLRERGVEAIVSTNAIHLYYDLQETMSSWRRALRDDGRIFIQSGNIGMPYTPAGAWIIDETVDAIHQAAMEIVREDDTLADLRPLLDDEERMQGHERLRKKFFLPVRPIDHYLERIERADFTVREVTHLPIEAHVDQWYEFLSAYHEGVLGWVGGSRRVEGTDPSAESVERRLALIRRAMGRIFGGRGSFQALWTYITADPS